MDFIASWISCLQESGAVVAIANQMVSAVVEGEGSTVARFLERSTEVGAFSCIEQSILIIIKG